MNANTLLLHIVFKRKKENCPIKLFRDPPVGKRPTELFLGDFLILNSLLCVFNCIIFKIILNITLVIDRRRSGFGQLLKNDPFLFLINIICVTCDAFAQITNRWMCYCVFFFIIIYFVSTRIIDCDLHVNKALIGWHLSGRRFFCFFFPFLYISPQAELCWSNCKILCMHYASFLYYPTVNWI